MADENEPQSQLEQLLELFVYAPVGMIYEYEEVLPKLVRRGKSQVQLAKVLGQMAAKKGQEGLDGAVGGAAGGVAGVVAQGITELGTKVGLAPSEQERALFVPDGSEEPDSATPEEPTPSSALPIAGYDGLKANEVVPLLGDLTPAQRDRVAKHEVANRNRKTVLAKLDRLAED